MAVRIPRGDSRDVVIDLTDDGGERQSLAGAETWVRIYKSRSQRDPAMAVQAFAGALDPGGVTQTATIGPNMLLQLGKFYIEITIAWVDLGLRFSTGDDLIVE